MGRRGIPRKPDWFRGQGPVRVPASLCRTPGIVRCVHGIFFILGGLYPPCPKDLSRTNNMSTEIPRYNPAAIEAKWQQEWERLGLYRTVEDSNRPKWYALTMLPYPSGDLHVGHWYAMTPSDTAARYRRMQGANVFFPIGFDAFGLPAENAAIENGIHPRVWTYDNIDNMRRQLRQMGAMWAWDREAVTCEPGYYKWSQWFFLRLLEADLAYREKAPVDWCPRCNTTLAREQVWGEDKHCERCGTPVIQKELEQWKFRITNYADELLADLENIEWPDPVKIMQTNWIGRSTGAQVAFHTEDGQPIEVFTTRPDTLWGATFMVLAPEHPLVAEITTDDRRATIEAYVENSARLNEAVRTDIGREKTGEFTGAYAVNPVNGARIPIWIADYVMLGYGTGAIMAVPGHDERDFAFAEQFGLDIVRVISGPDGATGPLAEAWPSKEDGAMMNSGAVQRHPGGGGRGQGHCLAGGNRQGPCPSQLPAARLAHLPPAHVGHAHSDCLLRRLRDGTSVLRPASRMPAGEDRVPALRRECPAAYAVVPEHGMPEVRPGGQARNRHDGHLHVLVVVPVRLRGPLLGRRQAPDPRRAPLEPRGRGLLAARGSVHRRHRARHHAPTLHAVLHQGPA